MLGAVGHTRGLRSQLIARPLWRNAIPKHSLSGLQASAAISVSAVLIALAAPGIGRYPILAWVAFAPWLASLSRMAPASAAVSGLVMGMAYIVPGRWSTFNAAIEAAGYQGDQLVAFTLLFFLVFALPFALFGALDRRLQRFAGGTLQRVALMRAAVLASLICGIWSPFAYTPASMVVEHAPMLQLAAIGGEPLLLCVLLWPSALLAGLLQGRMPVRQRFLAMMPLGLSLLAIAACGYLRINAMDQAEASGAGIRLSALPLQLDLPAHASPMLLTRDRAHSTLSALELSRDGLQRAPSCELVVWPETPVDKGGLAQACAAGPQIADSLGVPLMMQCQRPKGARSQISAEWLRPGQRDTPFHGKSSLVPLYEKPLWSEGTLTAGDPGTVFALDEQRRLIPTLCYELHSREHLRVGVLAGGNVIVHMASFAPFARHPIDIWDQGMSRLRAVEFGTPIVRATNRGPVGWIDALGRERSLSARFGSQAQCVSVWSPAGAPVLHAYLAPIAAWLPALMILLLSAAGRLTKHSLSSTTRLKRSTQ
jgi:apolipoprotein N-acyltransferase